MIIIEPRWEAQRCACPALTPQDLPCEYCARHEALEAARWRYEVLVAAVDYEVPASYW